VHMDYGYTRPETVHGISSIRVADGFLDDYKMHMPLVLILFCWLIFMYTLCDP
jgi:hypothetical protein